MPKDISERGSAMNQRMKSVRESLGLSQAIFAENAGIGLGVIRNIDYNKTEPNPLFFNILCDHYNINPQWLETGEGDMFVEKTREEEIAEWAASLNDSGNDFKRRFIYALSRLDEAGWLTIEHFAQMLYEEQLAEEEQAKQKDGRN